MELNKTTPKRINQQKTRDFVHDRETLSIISQMNNILVNCITKVQKHISVLIDVSHKF